MLAGRRRGNAERPQPSGRRQDAIALLPRVAADSVENKLDPAAVGDLARARLEILRAVVDEVVNAERPEFGVLTGGSRSDHLSAEVLGDLRRGDADAAARRMHENGLVALEAAHDHDKLPGGRRS